eukprot:2696727-Pyramimonas_sp.AAC.1
MGRPCRCVLSGGPLLEPAPAPAAAAPSSDTVGDEGLVEPQASAGSVRPRVSGESKQASRLLCLPCLDATSVAKLHGFSSPDELVRWERS